jgi:diguanylate cyclase
MELWRDLQRFSYRQRDTMMAIGALLTFALLLTLAQYIRLSERFREDLQTQTNLVARMASAVMLFDNRDDAAEILGAFDDAPEIVSAALLRPAGPPLSTYERVHLGPAWLDRLAGREQVSAPVLANQLEIGRLVVSARRQGIWIDLLRFIGVASGMLVAALALAWLGSHKLRANVRAAERRTRYLALNDALTDLPNREAFRLALERAVERGPRHGQGLALMFIDLDNFKQINDNDGHAAGDLVLETVAQRLRSVARSGDTVARLAGDEFAMLMEAPVDEELARRMAAQVVSIVPQPVSDRDAWLRVSVSVGVTLVPRDAVSAAEAMQCADVAMYHAKRQGKDGYQVYTPEIGEGERSRLRLEQDLREALQAGKLQLTYPPLFDAEGRLLSFEGLSRWRHPQRGWISPAEFVPVAEASGLIVDLGLHALRVLRRDIDALHAQGLNCPPVAINLSSRQCRRAPQRERFLALLNELALGPSSLEFELTESSVFEDLDKPESIVLKLQGLGYVLAIDDFGTGYSSLAYLRRMRCRKLKIDRLFINGLSGSPDGRTLVESIVRVAHSMHMLVVAEGVEMEADRQCLVEMGCDLFQGFGLSRPLTPAQMADLLRRQAAVAG